MSKMKKRISVITVVILALGLSACGNKEAQVTNDATQTVQSERSREAEATNDTEEGAEQGVTSEAASNTNDEIVEDQSSEETGSSDENGGVIVISDILSGGVKSRASWIRL